MSIRDVRDDLDENDPVYRDARGIQITIAAGRARVVIDAREGELRVHGDRVEAEDEPLATEGPLIEEEESGLSRVTVLSQINEA